MVRHEDATNTVRPVTPIFDTAKPLMYHVSPLYGFSLSRISPKL
jgi:hypothetical protein